MVVPGTGGARGIAVALAAGVIAGHPEKKLELLDGLTPADEGRLKDFLSRCEIQVEPLESSHIFDIQLTAICGTDRVRIRIVDAHTNVVFIEKNGEVIMERPVEETAKEEQADRSLLNVEDIVTFAEMVSLEELRPILERQLEMNWAIAQEGLRRP